MKSVLVFYLSKNVSRKGDHSQCVCFMKITKNNMFNQRNVHSEKIKSVMKMTHT